jgi:hypothetical protein
MRKLSLVAAAALSLVAMAPTMARADDGAKIQAMIQRLGGICKTQASARNGVPMSDVRVDLAATLKESIDSGETTLKDIKQYGLMYNYKLKRNGVVLHGSCDVEANGTIDHIEEN